MTFSWDFNLGHVVMIVVPLMAVIAGYVTLRVKAADNDERTKGLGTRVDAYGIALADLRLHVEVTCVKKDDLEKVEGRITSRIGELDHQVRGVPMAVAGLLNSVSGRRGGNAA